MITLFNRRELISAYSMKQQAEIREKLNTQNIEYIIKIINRKSSSPFSAVSIARTGTFGEDPELAYRYIILCEKTEF